MSGLASFVHTFEDCFDGTKTVQIIESVIASDQNSMNWKPSVVGINKQIVQMRSSLICEFDGIFHESKFDSELSLVIDGIERCIWGYREMYDIPLSRNPGWHVNKYPIGAEYGEHIDVHQREERVVSVVAMLNTVNDGGELVFTDLDISIPAKNGTVVIFPSSFPFAHASMPTVSGNKYSLVTWLS